VIIVAFLFSHTVGVNIVVARVASEIFRCLAVNASSAHSLSCKSIQLEIVSL